MTPPQPAKALACHICQGTGQAFDRPCNICLGVGVHPMDWFAHIAWLTWDNDRLRTEHDALADSDGLAQTACQAWDRVAALERFVTRVADLDEPSQVTARRLTTLSDLIAAAQLLLHEPEPIQACVQKQPEGD